MDETNAETETSRKARTAPRNETLEAQVAQLQTDIRTISESLAKLGADKLEEAKSTAKSTAQKAISEAQNEFDAVERQLKDSIREKPLTAVAAALAIGYLIAALTR